VVLDEVAVLCSMGAESRRGERAGVERELLRYREVRRIELPATLEGGDVLRVGRRLLVGLSARTNRAGAEALEAVVQRFGYRVLPVPVRGCLHLKTACTALPDDTLLVNPCWVDLAALEGFRTVRVPVDEPWAANTLTAGETVLLAAEYPRTAHLLRRRQLDVRPVALSELAKAEGAVTCMALLLNDAVREAARECAPLA
jgi:dimethylargininase